SLQNLSQPDLTAETVMTGLTTFSIELAKLLGPVFAVMMAVGVIANLAQVGFVFTLHPLKPDFARLNPFEGAKRLISVRSLVELVKSIAKLAIVAFVVWKIVEGRMTLLLLLPRATWQAGVATVV